MSAADKILEQIEQERESRANPQLVEAEELSPGEIKELKKVVGLLDEHTKGLKDARLRASFAWTFLKNWDNVLIRGGVSKFSIPDDLATAKEIQRTALVLIKNFKAMKAKVEKTIKAAKAK